MREYTIPIAPKSGVGERSTSCSRLTFWIALSSSCRWHFGILHWRFWHPAASAGYFSLSLTDVLIGGERKRLPRRGTDCDVAGFQAAVIFHHLINDRRHVADVADRLFEIP
jgi:hypothetical protein